MKHIVFSILSVSIILLTCSCSNDADVAPAEVQTAPVTVTVNDFSMSVEQFAPRRTPQTVASYDGVKAITLAFYDSENVEKYKITQLRADNTTFATFGQFSFSLPMGSYTMVVLGYGSENAMTLTGKTDATFTNDRVRETFVYTQAVNVTNIDPLNINATLSRVVARLEVQSTDKRTANATQIRTTFSAGGQGLNPMTGFSTTETGFSNLVTLAQNVGSISGSINYLFLNSDIQEMTVTIDVLDAENTSLSHHVVENVPLQRNRVTRLKGVLFSSSASSAFSVETAWLGEDNEIDF